MSTRSRPLLAAAVLLALLAMAAPAGATVVVPAEFREIVTDAGLIVRGRVTDVRTVRSAQGDVTSVATVLVEAVLKGASASFVSVVVPGGDIGHTRVVMVGSPRLTVNDTAVFFLKRGTDNLWRPVGLSMGVFRVRVDPATGRPAVNPPVFLSRTAAAGPVVRGDAARHTLSVSEFDALVRVAITGVTQPIGRMR